MYNKIVIGIDQSYSRTGISIAADSKLKKVSSIDFSQLKIKDNSSKRLYLECYLDKIINLCKKKSTNVYIYIERIRTFNTRQSHASNSNDKKLIMSAKYMISTGALLGKIIDIAYKHKIKVYSVDTRSWKAQVLGTNKVLPKDEKEEKPPKMNSIRYIESLGWNLKLRNKNEKIKRVSKGKKKGAIKYDDDAADSGCIALYGFIPQNKQKLKEEKF